MNLKSNPTYIGKTVHSTNLIGLVNNFKIFILFIFLQEKLSHFHKKFLS